MHRMDRNNEKVITIYFHDFNNYENTRVKVFRHINDAINYSNNLIKEFREMGYDIPDNICIDNLFIITDKVIIELEETIIL